MKRLITLLIALSVLFAFTAFAQAPAPAKPEHHAKATHKTLSGKVTELTDTALKVEVTVKGKAEVKEFVLEKALTGIAVGDEVTVAYQVKDAKNVAMKVVKKEVPPAAAPAVAPAPAPKK
jgi:hypothetical protein